MSMQKRIMTTMVLLVGGAALLASPPVEPQTYGLSVAVSEGRGQAVAGLTAADFLVRVGDVDATVTGVEVDPRPVSAVVIMDGVESEEALQARAALNAVLRRLRQTRGTRIGLMLGQGGATPPAMRDAVEAADDLAHQVSRFFRSEITAPPQDMLAGAAEALVSEQEEGRRHVVLAMSVNRRPPQGQIPQTLLPALRRADVLLGALEVSPGRVGAGLDPALRLIQTAVGGRFERVPDITALEASAVRLASGMMSAYLVTFTMPGPVNGAVQVSVKGRPRVTVMAPTWALR
jgi:hypothetical protein